MSSAPTPAAYGPLADVQQLIWYPGGSRLAGAFFGAVMNLSLWVTFSGDHSLAKLGAYFVTSLPFDLAHATGSCLILPR